MDDLLLTYALIHASSVLMMTIIIGYYAAKRIKKGIANGQKKFNLDSEVGMFMISLLFGPIALSFSIGAILLILSHKERDR